MDANTSRTRRAAAVALPLLLLAAGSFVATTPVLAAQTCTSPTAPNACLPETECSFYRQVLGRGPGGGAAYYPARVCDGGEANGLCVQRDDGRAMRDVFCTERDGRDRVEQFVNATATTLLGGVCVNQPNGCSVELRTTLIKRVSDLYLLEDINAAEHRIEFVRDRATITVNGNVVTGEVAFAQLDGQPRERQLFQWHVGPVSVVYQQLEKVGVFGYWTKASDQPARFEGWRAELAVYVQGTKTTSLEFFTVIPKEPLLAP